MKAKLSKLLSKFIILTSLYNSALGVWSGTIYLFMKHIHYSYTDINIFLAIFWVVTFFAELPSGILADIFGRINVFILSCITRSIGLFFLFFDTGNGYFLVISGILTALGDSFYSGTLDSWFVDKAKSIDKSYRLDHVFSITTTLSTALSLITGFIGAQLIANVSLGYPLLIGAILLLVPIPIAFGEKEDERREAVTVQNLKQAIIIGPKNWKRMKSIVKKTSRSYYLAYHSYLLR
ncbi:MFS transporter [Lentilactobacillus diolivorans]|uniref:MFS transporter n=1 Tax=Lentilactobacillus diolivorans TaxID=179838 RepID=UPI002468C353|nr:MFS transporter [Lentilactobacillus diolivorans]MDH5105509.1 MFS transporter [Lentilactobacillus diolivorans]